MFLFRLQHIKQDFHYTDHVWCGTQSAETCSNCPLDGCGGECTDPCKDIRSTKRCETTKKGGWCNSKKGKKYCQLTCGHCEPEKACVDAWKFKIPSGGIFCWILLRFENDFEIHTTSIPKK